MNTDEYMTRMVTKLEVRRDFILSLLMERLDVDLEPLKELIETMLELHDLEKAIAGEEDS